MTLEQKQEMSVTKETARIMYLHSNLNQKAIAAELDISEQTMSAWVNDNHWADLKANLSVSQDELISRLERLLQKTLAQNERYLDDDDPETNPDNDGVVKLAKSLEYMKKIAGPSQIYQAGIEFIGWLKKEDPATAQIVAPLFKKFTMTLVRSKSK